MVTEARPEGILLASRLGAMVRGSAAALVVAGTGAASALAAVLVVSAAGAWDLGPASQVPVDATVGVAFSVMAAVVLTSSTIGQGSRMLARVMLTAGACSGVAALATAVSLAATSSSPITAAAVQVQGMVWVPGFVPLLTLVPLLYPDGLLPGRTWRWAAVAAVVGTMLLTVGIGLFPETFHGRVQVAKPVSDLTAARALTAAAAVLLVPAVLVALAAPVVRLRRSRDLARRQLLVLLVAAAVLAAVTAAQGLLATPADVICQAAAAGLVAVAIGVAVTRHGLYDLDVAVSRGLVAASLAVCLTGAYLTLFALLQALPEHRSALSAAVAAGVTGVVVQPLGRRLTSGVDRLYYGDRADPFAVTSEVAARLTATGLDVARVPQVVCDTVVGTLRLRGARLLLAVGDVTREVAVAGASYDDAPAGFELRHRGDVVGRLEVWPRTGERVLHERDAVVLRAIADQVSPAVAALQLHQQLQRGREALVSAREDERLQLRRDLHDGLGATLAGLRLQIETALDLTGEETVRNLLGSAGTGVAEAVAEVRAITDDLRPAGIDELGLPRALAALADRVRVPGLDVRVDVDPAIRADPAVEVALHRIAGEALANVARPLPCDRRHADGPRRPAPHAGRRRRRRGRGERSRDGRVGTRPGLDAAAGRGGRRIARGDVQRRRHHRARRTAPLRRRHAMTDRPTAVLLVDDHPLFLDGVRAALSGTDGITVVGEAHDRAGAVEQAAALRPDVVLMDLNLPDGSGIDATREILATAPGTRVLVITMSADDDAVVAAMRAGARGYVVKGSGRADLVRAVTTVAAGGAVFGPTVAERLGAFFGGLAAQPGRELFPQLSDREREVLDLVARGHDNRRIARELFRSEKTVRNNVSTLLAKLDVADRAEAISRARRAGLGQEPTA